MFERKAIESAACSWNDASEINGQLEELKALKVNEIRVEGHLAKSKLAWKIATLSQACLRRLVELAEATAFTWNQGYYISALTLARSVIETGAILCDIDENVKKHLDKEDLKGLDDFVMNRTFSTKLEDWLNKGKVYKATNILTIIQKKDRQLPGLLDVYNGLSEYAHPNHVGLSQHYGDLDRTNGTVSYKEHSFLKAKFHSILCALTFIGFGYHAYKRLEESIKKVAELQHRINPVK